MAVFELILGLLLGGVGLALLAPRLGVPWQSLLAVAGAILAFVPGLPDVRLDPDLALALFVAPVLLDSAYDTSLRDLSRNWMPVVSLVLGAVALTVLSVAGTAHALRPDLPWAAAVALGAIVAPPDAAAAAAVLKQVRLPYRMVVILEGESLLNDASALLTYRFAIAAAATSLTVWGEVLLLGGALAGVLLGFVLAHLYLGAVMRVTDQVASTVLGFLGTFGVWLLADALGLSAVLTMVAFALTLARSAPERLDARQRRASYAVWPATQCGTWRCSCSTCSPSSSSACSCAASWPGSTSRSGPRRASPASCLRSRSRRGWPGSWCPTGRCARRLPARACKAGW